ncbi:hypothetical protein ILUMI_09391 [Ignelater luminosus]|uniref:Magnesium-dependent phosphatase 1 n=1 Tax=Ignelater luminosus TaxID=2038154 RepID=A0A8K0GG11_IGNLU|nr:hypothetical protein ILUMI_09391 [Ignelater luminosus]
MFKNFVVLSLLFHANTIMGAKKPKLIVFDLDYTLWPFWVDTHVTPPFKRGPSGKIADFYGQIVKCYPEVPEVLNKLHQEGYVLAVASRTGEIEGAEELLELFGWNKYITYKEIYPGRKVTHFENFKKKSGIPLQDMLFFDDETRNINDLRSHGVTSILVKNGVTKGVVEAGLKQYEKEHSA